MPRNLDDLLRDTAVPPSRDIDPAALIACGRRRGRRRRAVATSAVVAVAAIGVFGTVRVFERQPQILLQPVTEQPSAPSAEPTRQPREPAPGAFGPGLDVENLPRLPAEGIAVQRGDRVVLIGLDGKRHGHVKAAFADSPFGLRTRTNVLALAGSKGQWWVDPGSGRYQSLSFDGAPLWNDHRVVRFADAGIDQSMQLDQRRGNVASWSERDRWWLSADHRLVTWRRCAQGDCRFEAYDTDMGGALSLSQNCWAAYALGDFALTQICNGGRRILTVFGGGDQEIKVDVPEGIDAQPAKAVAVFDDGIVRIDHATCDVSEVRRLNKTDLDPVLGDDPFRTPSAVPLGVTDDGDIVVHFNSAACDAGAAHPGVYLINPKTGERTAVWKGSAHRDEVQMWAPTGASFDSR